MIAAPHPPSGRLWLQLGLALLPRAGAGERRRGRRAPPAAVAGTVAPASAPGGPAPAPGWGERPGAGWTEPRVPLRGGGWEGVRGAERSSREEAPGGRRRIWGSAGSERFVGAMDSEPLLLSVFTLLFSGLWHPGLTATNCKCAQEPGRGGDGKATVWKDPCSIVSALSGGEGDAG